MGTIERTFPLPPIIRAKVEQAEKARAKQRAGEDLNNCCVLAQLPLWGDSRRAMPNEYARSAIFTVRNKKVPRRSFTNHEIFVVGNCEISYTGVELRAYDDELVWLEIINLAKVFPLGGWIEFTPYQICRALLWPTNGAYYRKVHECLLRLKATAVALHNKRIGKGKAVSFVEAYEWEDASGNRLSKNRVQIHPDMQSLFAQKQFTELEWGEYRKLNPIARRLYDYAASNKKPYPLLLETVREMCASDCDSRERRWKEQIIDALNELLNRKLIQCGRVVARKVYMER